LELRENNEAFLQIRVGVESIRDQDPALFIALRLESRLFRVRRWTWLTRYRPLSLIGIRRRSGGKRRSWLGPLLSRNRKRIGQEDD